jgi:hypothetical protein
MTRSKELRRIEEAIAHKNVGELRWALAQCELRKKFVSGKAPRLYLLEKRIRAALDEAGNP